MWTDHVCSGQLQQSPPEFKIVYQILVYSILYIPPTHFRHHQWWALTLGSSGPRGTSHTRLRARDHYTSNTLIGGKGGGAITLRLRDQRSMWMQGGCKVYMDSYMASNGSCFMVTWTIFKTHLLKVGLSQNQETMALRTLTTVGLFHFIMSEDPHE